MVNRTILFLVIVSTLIISGCFIQGRVVDKNGAGIAGVTVTLSGDLSRVVTTNNEGKYRFGDLLTGDIVPAGSYIVTPSKSGYSFVPASTNVTITGQSVGDLEDIPGPDMGVDFASDSEPVYEQHVRTSQYVEVRDGTKLAVDIFRPSRDGNIPVDDPLPVVLVATPYHRADIVDGQVFTVLDSQPVLDHILKHGYVISCLDVRGSGASYGTRNNNTPEEAQDMYDMVEWFAAQPWCDENVGMFGRSYLGLIQYWTATQAPPHLKAIAPHMATFDGYDGAYQGGILLEKFIRAYQAGNILMDTIDLAPPVDADRDGSMLSEAVEEHKQNNDVYEMTAATPYRNSFNPITGYYAYEGSTAYYIDEIDQSGVPVYHCGGWFDLFGGAPFLWFNNLTNPQKVIVGPWTHMEEQEFDWAAEHLRWYDYWLKQIDNGIMDEPPVRYYVMGAPEGDKWRTTWEWPLPNLTPTNYYFAGGQTTTVDSVNDGGLITESPKTAVARDTYMVNFTTTTDRLKNRFALGLNQPLSTDMTVLDEKGLTYTTAPLKSDMQITGNPVLHMWISSTATDGDFFVYLEEIDAEGISWYLTEVILRASHRVTAEPEWDNMGLPWNRGFEEDIIALNPGEPTELVCTMSPTSNIFDEGHRIRVTVTCADKNNFLTPELSPPPTVTVYRNSDYPSYITLPVIPIGGE